MAEILDCGAWGGTVRRVLTDGGMGMEGELAGSHVDPGRQDQCAGRQDTWVL